MAQAQIWTPPSVSLHSPLYRLSTLSIQAREGEGVIYKEIRKGVWRGTKNPNLGKFVTPEVCLAIRRKWDWPKSGVVPKSILVILQKSGIPKNGVPRGPSFRFRKWDQPKTGRGPEDDREMPQRLLAVPEDDLKSYCKTADSATLQYPSDWPEDGLKPYWVKIPNRGNQPPPRSVPLLSRGWPCVCLTENVSATNPVAPCGLRENPESGNLRTPASPYRKWACPKSGNSPLCPLTENAPRANPVAPCDPERKWPEGKIAHPCVCLRKNALGTNFLTPAPPFAKMLA